MSPKISNKYYMYYNYFGLKTPKLASLDGKPYWQVPRSVHTKADCADFKNVRNEKTATTTPLIFGYVSLSTYCSDLRARSCNLFRALGVRCSLPPAITPMYRMGYYTHTHTPFPDPMRAEFPACVCRLPSISPSPSPRPYSLDSPGS